MKPVDYPPGLKMLVSELKRMPGIGSRSAERIALWMIQSRDARPLEISRALCEATQTIKPCQMCGFFATAPLCEICAAPGRDTALLCVVEQATDILPLERTGSFRGRYHALGGRISPLDHIGPDDLRINALLARIKTEHPAEIILALGADVEGEATSNYLAELLREFPITISRLAQGLPAGGGLEHADELTIQRALAGRTRL